MDGRTLGSRDMSERVRGVNAVRSDRARREEPRQELLFARGPLRHADVRGGQGRLVQAAEGQDARPRRRIGLGQDDRRPHADAPAPGDLRRGDLRGPRHPVDVGEGVHALEAAHPDHLPEPVRVAQPALHDRQHPDRADGDPRHRRQRAGAHRPRVRAPEEGRACPRSRSTSTRTSSPAGSGSGSRSRAASR